MTGPAAPADASEAVPVGTTEIALFGTTEIAPVGTTEIAVVGAHMSGLPLNGQLTALGGWRLRAASTAPCYRLYLLPGGPPARPGLLRVPEQAGAAIAAEVWAVPTEAIGRLLAAIPPPLGLGTVRLDDGSAPKGFLVEAEGVRGAADISHLGGWRAFLADRAP